MAGPFTCASPVGSHDQTVSTCMWIWCQAVVVNHSQQPAPALTQSLVYPNTQSPVGSQTCVNRDVGNKPHGTTPSRQEQVQWLWVTFGASPTTTQGLLHVLVSVSVSTLTAFLISTSSHITHIFVGCCNRWWRNYFWERIMGVWTKYWWTPCNSI